MPSTEPQQKLTINKAAEILDVDRQTVRRWIGQGKLRAYRYGERFIRIDPEDLDAFRTQIAANTFDMAGGGRR